MRILFRTLLWLLVLTIALWTAFYFFQHLGSLSFQEGAMGNLFATILGVVVGIPIALEINRRQRLEEHAASASRLQREEAKRKHKVLSLLRTELLSNKEDVLVRRKPIETGGKRTVQSGFLRDVMWAAFSDGGELHFVNNPEVLASIASAYHEIRATVFLERGFVDAAFYPGMRINQNKSSEDRYLEALTATDADLLAAIERAMNAIDAELIAVGSVQ